jgi:HEAT repeat protein
MSFQQRIFGLSLEKIQSSNDVNELAAALQLDHAVLQGKTRVQAARLAAIQRLAELNDPRAMEPIVAALRDEDRSVRNAAVQALGRTGDPRAVPALIECLQDRYWEPRLPVVQALGQICDSRAVQPLIAALKDQDQHVQRAAIESLAQIGDPGAAQPLVAIESLAQIGDPGAAQPLVAILQAIDKPARRSAVQALDRIGWKPGKDEAAAAYWAAQGSWEQCARIGAPAVNVLVEALQDRNESQRPEIARALGQISDRRAVEALAASIKDSDVKVRLVAASSLGQSAEPRAVRALLAASKDPDKTVREAAASSLAQLGPKALPVLATALQDDDLQIRLGAATLLSQFGTQAVPALIGALQNGDLPLRCEAAKSLGSIGDARAVQPLIITLNVQDFNLRQAAEAALDRIDWNPGKDEAGAAYWIARGKWERCVEIGAPAVELLIGKLKDPKYQVRFGAIEALGQIGDPRAVPPLIDALGDPDWSVRKRSASALQSLGDASAVKPLIKALSDANREVRQSAGSALVALYQSQSLGEKERALILEQKGTIAQPHEDRWEYTGRSSDCTSYHVDSGIGVEFAEH